MKTQLGYSGVESIETPHPHLKRKLCIEPGNTEMVNQVDFAKSTLNSEINLIYIIIISPYNVFSFTSYHKVQHFKP